MSALRMCMLVPQVWLRFNVSWSLANPLSLTCVRWRFRHSETRYSPSVVTYVGSTVREQAECCRGKPVVICILAFSLVFHAVTLKCSSFRENATYISTYTRRCICGIVCGAIHDVAVWTDRQTHSHNYSNPRCAWAPRVNNYKDQLKMRKNQIARYW